MTSAVSQPRQANSSGSSKADVLPAEEAISSPASKQHSGVASPASSGCPYDQRSASMLPTSPHGSRGLASPAGKRQRDREPAADELDATGVASAKKAKRATISFGAVEILTHAPALDGCKMPSDGQAPMGLGRLETIQLRRIASYDLERQTQREGTHLIPASERRSMLRTIGLHRTASIDNAEDEIARLREAPPVELPPSIPVPAPAEEVGIVELWA